MSTSAISARIREAGASRRSLRIVAAGRWLDAGGRVAADDTLSVADDSGIVEYVPGDLTMTARGGTRLADLVAAVQANDQWLPLDPWGGDGGTLGATLSTATAGPHSQAMGLPRDVTLGVEFVSGTGDVVRAGGRVVKNVAGFDLARLVIGAWGSLGVITEATLRLRARPAVLRTFLMRVDTDADSLDRLAVDLRTLPFTPLASELVNGRLARRLGGDEHATLILRLAGNAQSVNAQTTALRKLGPLADAPPDVWRGLRECDRDADVSWRRSQVPSAFGHTWSGVEGSTREITHVLVHGSPLRGVVRAVASGTGEALRRGVADGPGTLVVEKFRDQPLPVDRTIDRRKVSMLEDRIRNAFDPLRILNPGIMGEQGEPRSRA